MNDGDKNSCFFHNSLKERYRRNAISLLEGENGRVDEIKELIKNHFERFFKEENTRRPISEGVSVNCISENEREWIEREFSVEEVKEAV